MLFGFVDDEGDDDILALYLLADFGFGEEIFQAVAPAAPRGAELDKDVFVLGFGFGLGFFEDRFGAFSGLGRFGGEGCCDKGETG